MDAFNAMMVDFLTDLSRVYPDNDAVKQALVSPPSMTRFMHYLEPEAARLTSKDVTLLKRRKNKFLQQIGISQEEVSPENAAAIMRHLHGMFLLASSCSSVPPETLSMIERVAENIQGSLMKDGEMDKQAFAAFAAKMMSSTPPSFDGELNEASLTEFMKGMMP